MQAGFPSLCASSEVAKSPPRFGFIVSTPPLLGRFGSRRTSVERDSAVPAAVTTSIQPATELTARQMTPSLEGAHSPHAGNGNQAFPGLVNLKFPLQLSDPQALWTSARSLIHVRWHGVWQSLLSRVQVYAPYTLHALGAGVAPATDTPVTTERQHQQQHGHVSGNALAAKPPGNPARSPKHRTTTSQDPGRRPPPERAVSLRPFLTVADQMEVSYASMLSDLCNLAYDVGQLTGEQLQSLHHLQLIGTSVVLAPDASSAVTDIGSIVLPDVSAEEASARQVQPDSAVMQAEEMLLTIYESTMDLDAWEDAPAGMHDTMTRANEQEDEVPTAQLTTVGRHADTYRHAGSGVAGSGISLIPTARPLAAVTVAVEAAAAVAMYAPGRASATSVAAALLASSPGGLSQLVGAGSAAGSPSRSRRESDAGGVDAASKVFAGSIALSGHGHGPAHACASPPAPHPSPARMTPTVSMVELSTPEAVTAALTSGGLAFSRPVYVSELYQALADLGTYDEVDEDDEDSCVFPAQHDPLFSYPPSVSSSPRCAPTYTDDYNNDEDSGSPTHAGYEDDDDLVMPSYSPFLSSSLSSNPPPASSATLARHFAMTQGSPRTSGSPRGSWSGSAGSASTSPPTLHLGHLSSPPVMLACSSGRRPSTASSSRASANRSIAPPATAGAAGSTVTGSEGAATAVSQAGVAAAAAESHSGQPPAAWFCADDPLTHTRYFVIQGSSSMEHWQINLQFEPMTFEDEALGVRVHRGVYEAALELYDVMLPMVTAHLATSPLATVSFTGHSLGGSLGSVIMLLLVARGVTKPSQISPVYTFGAPAVFCQGAQPGAPPARCSDCSLDCEHRHAAAPPLPPAQRSPVLVKAAGADKTHSSAAAAGELCAQPIRRCEAGKGLLHCLGLSDDHIVNIIMHKDIVPRAFVCDYGSVAGVLQRWWPSFRNHSSLQPGAGPYRSLYGFIGRVSILRPSEAEEFVKGASDVAHPMLPSLPALYRVSLPDDAVLPPHLWANSVDDGAVACDDDDGVLPPPTCNDLCGGTSGAAAALADGAARNTRGWDDLFHQAFALAGNGVNGFMDHTDPLTHPAASPASTDSGLSRLGHGAELCDTAPASKYGTQVQPATARKEQHMQGITSACDTHCEDTRGVVGGAAAAAAGASCGVPVNAGGPVPMGTGRTCASVSAAAKASEALRLALMQFMNMPHPLTTLSDYSAYGHEGAISRYHNPNNYTRALVGLLAMRL